MDNASADDTPKYWAFISYSHRDQRWAEWVHRWLETYRVPRALVGRPGRDGRVPGRIAPVFRDRDELSSSPDLGDAIRAALANSRYLIVICSPRSAASRWVDQEIRAFKRAGRADRVLCLIVDGEPNASDGADRGAASVECFAPSLRFAVDATGELIEKRVEPIAADARPGRDGRADAALKLAAGILGVGFDDLKRREARRRTRRLLTTVATAAAFLGLATSAVLFFTRARHAGQTTSLSRQVEQQLGASRWTSADAEALDACITRMQALDPAEATRLRGKAAGELASDTQAVLDRPTLAPADVAEAERLIALLQPRDATAAWAIRTALSQRLRQWQTVRELASPYANFADVFDSGAAAVEGSLAGAVMTLRPAAATKLPSAGNIRVIAEFDLSAARGHSVGIALDAPGLSAANANVNANSKMDARLLFELGVPEDVTVGSNANPPAATEDRKPLDLFPTTLEGAVVGWEAAGPSFQHLADADGTPFIRFANPSAGTESVARRALPVDPQKWPRVRITARMRTRGLVVPELWQAPGVMADWLGEGGNLGRFVNLRLESDAEWSTLSGEGVTPATARRLLVGAGLIHSGGEIDFASLRIEPVVEFAAGTSLMLRISRGEQVLVERAMPRDALAGAPLVRLTAEREGRRLVARINDTEPLMFDELVAASGVTRGVIGVHATAPARLRRLAVERQPLPPAPSPLEEADTAYAVGEFDRAAALYQAQATRALSPSSSAGHSAEIHCKLGLSLAGAGRWEKAEEILAELAGRDAPSDADRRWILAGACRLWERYSTTKQFDKADLLSRPLIERFRPEEFERGVPAERRRLILLASGVGVRVRSLFLPLTPDELGEMVVRLEHLVSAGKVMNVPAEDQREAELRLVWAYDAAGRFDDAAYLLGQQIDVFAGYNGNDHIAIQACLTWSRLMCAAGRPGRAVGQVDNWIARVRLGGAAEKLRIERAILLFNDDRREEAGRALDDILADPNSLHRHEAALARGVMHDSVGDPAAAETVWRAGLAAHREAQRRTDTSGRDHAEFELQRIMLASLAGDVSDGDALAFAAFASGVAGRHGRVEQDGLQPSLLPVPPDVIRQLWADARARKLAIGYTLRTLGTRQVVSGLAVLGIETMLIHGTVGRDRLTSEQRPVVTDLAERLGRMAQSGELGTKQMLTGAATWKGMMLGWRGLAGSLPPEVRGPLAYLLGHRYRSRLNQPADAERLFRIAIDDSASGSSLRRLAESELAPVAAGTPAAPED